MDFAVFFAATAAHRDHVGSICQIDSEFFLKRVTKLIASHLLNELCKCGSVTDFTQRKAAGPVNSGIIIMYRRARIGLHEFRNNQEFKRLAGKWRRAEPLQIEH